MHQSDAPQDVYTTTYSMYAAHQLPSRNCQIANMVRWYFSCGWHALTVCRSLADRAITLSVMLSGGRWMRGKNAWECELGTHMCYLIPSLVKWPCVVPGNSWRDGRPGAPGDPSGLLWGIWDSQGIPQDTPQGIPSEVYPTGSPRYPPGIPQGPESPKAWRSPGISPGGPSKGPPTPSPAPWRFKACGVR